MSKSSLERIVKKDFVKFKDCVERVRFSGGYWCRVERYCKFKDGSVMLMDDSEVKYGCVYWDLATKKNLYS